MCSVLDNGSWDFPRDWHPSNVFVGSEARGFSLDQVGHVFVLTRSHLGPAAAGFLLRSAMHRIFHPNPVNSAYEDNARLPGS
jgi:hypothetical protein